MKELITETIEKYKDIGKDIKESIDKVLDVVGSISHIMKTADPKTKNKMLKLLISDCKLSGNKLNYFRYMDDVKFFTNNLNLAKKLLLELNRELRKLHLNTQSAKTQIFNEANNHEISHELIDSRIEKLKEIEIGNINELSFALNIP